MFVSRRYTTINIALELYRLKCCRSLHAKKAKNELQNYKTQ